MQVFAETGIAADREHLARLIGADGKRLAKEVADVAGRRIDDGRAEAIDKRSGEIFNEINKSPRPIAGARQLLMAISRSSLPWGIATSSRPEQVRVSIAALKLPAEPRIIDGSHVEHAKPAPDLLLLAAEKLRAQPDRCWYVGDSTWDMLAGRAAGMTGIGVPYGAASKTDLLNAGAEVASSFRSLLADLQRRGVLTAA